LELQLFCLGKRLGKDIIKMQEAITQAPEEHLESQTQKGNWPLKLTLLAKGPCHSLKFCQMMPNATRHKQANWTKCCINFREKGRPHLVVLMHQLFQASCPATQNALVGSKSA